MLDIGIIGLGPSWEVRYRPVLKKLRNRIRVRSIFDAVSNRAQLAAADFEADVAEGVRALIARPDIRAILLLDAHWHQEVPLRFACEFGKSVFIADGLGDQPEGLAKLRQEADLQGIDFMPEFARRYNPATSRLRELIATRLGRARQIRVDARLFQAPQLGSNGCREAELERLIGIVDWCHYLVGTPPRVVELANLPEGSNGHAGTERRLEIEFHRAPLDAEPPLASIFVGHAPPPDSETASTPLCEVICAHGTACVEDVASLTWEQQGQRHSESLTAERTDIEVMLDHFCRRVVGGLIPVPTIDDVRRALALVSTAEESERQGRSLAFTESPVPLPPVTLS